MAEMGTLGEVFDRGIEPWTQSTLFMDMSTRHLLKSFFSTQPVTYIVKSHMENLLMNGGHQWEPNP